MKNKSFKLKIKNPNQLTIHINQSMPVLNKNKPINETAVGIVIDYYTYSSWN